MQKEEIYMFLNSVFNDKKLLINITGAEKLYDESFMLITDVISDDLSLFSEVVEENLLAKSLTRFKIDNKNLFNLKREL